MVSYAQFNACCGSLNFICHIPFFKKNAQRMPCFCPFSQNSRLFHPIWIFDSYQQPWHDRACLRSATASGFPYSQRSRGKPISFFSMSDLPLPVLIGYSPITSLNCHHFCGCPCVKCPVPQAVAVVTHRPVV